MKHLQQTKRNSCWAACFAMIAGCSEEQAIKECQTKATGTNSKNVCAAFIKRNITPIEVDLNVEWNEYSRWLALNSMGRKLYVSGTFRDRYAKVGRDRIRHHAIVVKDGMVFDPSQKEPLPIEAFNHVFNKKLVIKSMIIVDIAGSL